MITKENRQALFRSQLSLFMAVIKSRVDRDASDLNGMCIKDGQNIAHVIGIVVNGGRPYGVDEIVSSQPNADGSPSGLDILVRGVLTEDQKSRGLENLLKMNRGDICARLMEIFSERYLTVTIQGEEVFSQKQRDTLCERVAPHVQKEIDAILDGSRVDRESLGIIDQNDPSYRSYAFYASKADQRADRHQAAASYPILSNVMADTMSVRMAIDSRSSLQSALIETSRLNRDGKPVLSKAMLKRMAGKRFSHNVDYSVLMGLSEISSDWFPKTDSEMFYASGIIKHLGFIVDHDIPRLLKASSGRFESFAKQIALAYADDRPPEGATPADMDYLDKVINMRMISDMSKKGQFEEIRSLASAVVGSDIPLPKSLSEGTVAQYITRRYAPDYSPAAMKNIHDIALHLIEVMERRVTVPLLGNLSGLSAIPVTHELISGANNLAHQFLFSGKSLLTCLEHIRKLNNQSGMLIYGEIGKRELAEATEEEEEIRIEALGGYKLDAQDRAMMKDAMASIGRQDWPTDFKPMRLGDVVIAPLLSLEDLTFEGEVMDNCLSDYYVGKCRSRASSILTIRRITGQGVKNLATVEYVDGQTSPYRLNTMLGYGNSYEVPLDAKNILIQYQRDVVDAINQSKSDRNVYKENIKNEALSKKQETDASKSGIDGIVDYDWRKRRLIERAMTPWTPYISKGYRVSIDDIAKMPIISDIISDINPRKSRHLTSSDGNFIIEGKGQGRLIFS